MEAKKLTLEQIQALRSNAEKERATHAEVLARLKLVTISPELQFATLKSSYERKRFDEIMALLKAYTPASKQYELSSEVQVFIYEHKDLSEARDYMLQNFLQNKHSGLDYDVEKRIIDDKLPPFIPVKVGGNIEGYIYPKFGKNAEVYMVKETLKACEKADKITDELKFLDTYTMKHPLCDAADTALMDFLFVFTGRDSKLYTLESFVMTYIGRVDRLSRDAQLRLIQSGNHNAIMHCIALSFGGIKDKKVVDALLERADAEEVTAYFKRWAREWSV